MSDEHHGLMRPGVKIPFWSHRFKHHPDVDAPALLRMVGALSIFSIVGTLVYAVFTAISATGLSHGVESGMLYIAVLHFVLPFVVLYTISTNSWLSRPFIALYNMILCGATIAGYGVLGSIEMNEILRFVFASAFLVMVVLWLYWSPAMRVYYAVISGRPIPEGLERYQNKLVAGSSLSPKWRGRIERLLEHMETLVMVGFIVVCIVVLATT